MTRIRAQMDTGNENQTTQVIKDYVDNSHCDT